MRLADRRDDAEEARLLVGDVVRLGEEVEVVAGDRDEEGAPEPLEGTGGVHQFSLGLDDLLLGDESGVAEEGDEAS